MHDPDCPAHLSAAVNASGHDHPSNFGETPSCPDEFSTVIIDYCVTTFESNQSGESNGIQSDCRIFAAKMCVCTCSISHKAFQRFYRYQHCTSFVQASDNHCSLKSGDKAMPLTTALSLLPTVSKLLEKAIAAQLKANLNNHSLLPQEQLTFAYR